MERASRFLIETKFKSYDGRELFRHFVFSAKKRSGNQKTKEIKFQPAKALREIT